MFISKKEYKALLESRDNWKALAEKALEQNEKLNETNQELASWSKKLMEDLNAIQSQPPNTPSWLN
jgi:hypothetical protein